MHISNSSIQLYSEHTSFDQQKRIESLNLNHQKNRGESKNIQPEGFEHGKGRTRNQYHDQIDFSHQAKRKRPQRANVTDVADKDLNHADLNIRILRALVQRLTGKVMDVRLPQDVLTYVNSDKYLEHNIPVEDVLANVGIEYDYYESHYEYESTSFTAQGNITTSDGVDIEFHVQLNMTREFIQEQHVKISDERELEDPLVVNFNGRAAELRQTDFIFDIDMDGRDEQVAFTRQSSGFLALDKNKDGLINDGKELFGPETGNGFAELARYDQDGNNWIDENDDIFHQLRIWMMNESGEHQLFSLGEKGVGAIYLNHIHTPFSVKNSENELLGQIQETGMFLNEDGTAGTIQQVDLAV